MLLPFLHLRRPEILQHKTCMAELHVTIFALDSHLPIIYWLALEATTENQTSLIIFRPRLDAL